MTTTLPAANTYTDLQSLDRMRYSGDKNPDETLGFVAQQFEALFLQMMLKSAHETGSEDGLFDNEQTEFYQDWYDKQLAINLSSGQGIGIAEMLVQQLKSQHLISDKNTQDGTKANAIGNSLIHQNVPSPREFPVSHSTAKDFITPAEKTGSPVQLGTPQAFVEHLWPMAKDAAEKLGVDPEVLLAQAALETGWGKKVVQNSSGRSSHNLFNIKADERWDGEKVTVPTLEYRDGIAVREQANFRAYSSYESSFSDYVEFLQNSPRYQDALSVAADGRAYTHELGRAGYATDPKYSNKIIGIMNGQPFQQALAAVKI